MYICLCILRHSPVQYVKVHAYKYTQLYPNNFRVLVSDKMQKVLSGCIRAETCPKVDGHFISGYFRTCIYLLQLRPHVATDTCSLSLNPVLLSDVFLNCSNSLVPISKPMEIFFHIFNLPSILSCCISGLYPVA